jgi:predicted O-methyltransferase YrrM
MHGAMPDPALLPAATLDRLIRAGTAAWDEFRVHAEDRHHLFIPCDHHGAYGALCELRDRATTFVELGSGAGVVTILADLLGFEAYGIELEPWLVERARTLAEDFGSGAVFAEGTFVPPDYQEEVEHLSGDFHTPTTGAHALEELDLELSDFDLLFAYPWPGEERWLQELLRRHARPGALLLTYEVCEGFRVSSVEPPDPAEASDRNTTF